MSSIASRTSLVSSSSSLSNKNKKPSVPAKKAVIKDQIVSSKFVDVKQFVPSYMKTERKPEIESLMSMEYAKIWEEEHKVYEKNVIGQKLIKKKTLKRPTFQPKCSTSTAAAETLGGGDMPSATRRKPEAKDLPNNKNSKPKAIWK